MLHFFRQIRKGLLKEHRLSKYLLYAVGEIVLVVIGILIALYLNDLKARSESSKKQLEYLQRFDSEMELNLKEIDRLLDQSENTLVQIDSLLAISFGETSMPSNATFNRHAKAAVDYLIFRSAEATVEDLLGSGDLSLIEDNYIREAIATWETSLMVIRSLETDHKKAFNDLLEYFRGNSEIYQVMRGRPFIPLTMQETLISDPVFLNTLAYHAIPLQMLNEEYKRKRKEFELLRDSVQKEIARLE